MNHIKLSLNLKLSYQGSKHYIKKGEPQNVENHLKTFRKLENQALNSMRVSEPTRLGVSGTCQNCCFWSYCKQHWRKTKNKIHLKPPTLYLPNHMPALQTSKIQEKLNQSRKAHKTTLTLLQTNKEHQDSCLYKGTESATPTNIINRAPVTTILL